MKLQIPTSNIQRNINNQLPIELGYIFEVWGLEFPCTLFAFGRTRRGEVLGMWSFGGVST
jgi:hypothetical protein